MTLLMIDRLRRNRTRLWIVLISCFWVLWGIQNQISAQASSPWVVAFDITQDGRFVVKGLSDRSIQLWDNQTKQLITTYPKPFPKLGVDAEITLNDIQFSPDNTQLAISFANLSGGQNGFVWVFSIPTGKHLIELDTHGYAGSLAWQPEGQKLAVAITQGSGSFEEYSFRVWNTGDWSIQQDIRLPNELLPVLSWSPDGHTLAVANGNLIHLYDATTWQILQKLTGHTDYITSIDWNDASTKLASSSRDQTLRIWDINSGTEMQQFNRQTPVEFSNFILWSSDQQKIIGLGDYTVEVWDTKSESLQASYNITPDWIVDAEKITDKIVYIGGISTDISTLDSLLKPEISS